MSLEGFFCFFLLFYQGEQKDDNSKSVVIIHKSQIGFSIQNGVQEMSRWADKVEKGFVEKLCFSSSLLPLAGVSGAVCGPAQPADPAGALQLPGAEILLGTAVGATTNMQEHAWLHKK